MPIYEYQCPSCGHQFETMQKISEAVLTKCPECGKKKLRKLVSAVAFRLKGGGWYETDFKSGGKKNVAGDTAKSEDKPADTDKKGKSEKDAPAAQSEKKETKAEPKAKSETRTKESKPSRSKDD